MTNSSALIQGLREVTNFKNTENGAVAHASTLDGVLDLFGLGGSYRNRSDEDVVSLFRDAYEEDPALAYFIFEMPAKVREKEDFLELLLDGLHLKLQTWQKI